MVVPGIETSRRIRLGPYKEEKPLTFLDFVKESAGTILLTKVKREQIQKQDRKFNTACVK